MCKECTKFGPACERGQVLLEGFRRAVKTTRLDAMDRAYRAYAAHIEGETEKDPAEPGGDNSESWYAYKNEQEEERACTTSN